MSRSRLMRGKLQLKGRRVLRWTRTNKPSQFTHTERRGLQTAHPKEMADGRHSLLQRTQQLFILGRNSLLQRTQQLFILYQMVRPGTVHTDTMIHDVFDYQELWRKRSRLMQAKPSLIWWFYNAQCVKASHCTHTRLCRYFFSVRIVLLCTWLLSSLSWFHTW